MPTAPPLTRLSLSLSLSLEQSKSYDDVPSNTNNDSGWAQWLIMLALGVASVVVYRYYSH